MERASAAGRRVLQARFRQSMSQPEAPHAVTRERADIPLLPVTVHYSVDVVSRAPV